MTIHRDASNAIADPNTNRRILFLSLEFNFSPFSGNGVLARSLVSSLAHRSDCVVRVACAKPHPSTPGISNDISMASCSGDGKLKIWPVNLPKHGCQWKRLDRSGPWQEFASACAGMERQVKEFQPTDVVAVDWHGMLAWELLRRALSINSAGASPWVPFNVGVCYYNFRVYSASLWEHTPSQSDKELEGSTSCDDAFYREREQLSCRWADKVVCLAEHDKCMLQRLMEADGNIHEDHIESKIKNISILHPPLRGDIWELASMDEGIESFDHYLPPEAKGAIERASSQTSSTRKRMFITCMVRFSPEKSPHHFVALMRKFGGEDFLRRNALIPIICGAMSVKDYAKKVEDDFQSICKSDVDGKAWPCVVINRHLGPKELAAIFSYTLVNVHPCLYDAYGMTLVESAAFGVPSIVNEGGKVGATSLLGEGKGCLAVDLENMVKASDDNHESQMIDSIRSLFTQIHNSQKAETSENVSLRKIAKEARSQALSWDESACCQGLIDILNGLPVCLI